MHRLLRPRPDGTLVVSNAAGVVGSSSVSSVYNWNNAQLASPTSPRRLLGVSKKLTNDVDLDYLADDFAEQLAAATPDRVDAYFDNTSGPITDAIVNRLNTTHR